MLDCAQIGDFGSFVFLNALSMHTGDDGSAMLTALTKCDVWSWCYEIRNFNASMTRESLDGVRSNGQTMSHSWGTGALSGIVHGIVGVQQTAPAWATFTVKPLLASRLEFVNATVPTIRGPIVVAATPGRLSVSIPCNTQAVLCVQHAHTDDDGDNNRSVGLLLLDGAAVGVTRTEQHLCTAPPVGCSAAPRVLSVSVRGEEYM